MSAKQNIYEESDPEASNDLSHLQFVARKTSKISVPVSTSCSINQKLETMNHTIIKNITVHSAKRLSANVLRKSLKNYHYKKSMTKIFGQESDQMKKDQQIVITTLISLMREFRQNTNRYFYIVYPKNQQIIYFYKKEAKDGTLQTYILYSSQRIEFKKNLQSENILFREIHELQQSHNNHTISRLLIKNQYANISWGKIFNSLISENRSYEIISNYPFLNCFEGTPIQIFNGIQIQQTQKYQSISEVKKNILGQSVYETYKLNIEGLWTLQNMRKLVQNLDSMYGQGKYALQYSEHPCTKSFNQIDNYLY